MKEFLERYNRPLLEGTIPEAREKSSKPDKPSFDKKAIRKLLVPSKLDDNTFDGTIGSNSSFASVFANNNSPEEVAQVFANLANFSKSISEDDSIPTFDKLSTLFILSEINNSFSPSSAGFFAEKFFSYYFGGEKLGGNNTIVDFKLGGHYYSLKTVKKGSEVKGSKAQLLRFFGINPVRVTYNPVKGEPGFILKSSGLKESFRLLESDNFEEGDDNVLDRRGLLKNLTVRKADADDESQIIGKYLTYVGLLKDSGEEGDRLFYKSRTFSLKNFLEFFAKSGQIYNGYSKLEKGKEYYAFVKTTQRRRSIIFLDASNTQFRHSENVFFGSKNGKVKSFEEEIIIPPVERMIELAEKERQANYINAVCIVENAMSIVEVLDEFLRNKGSISKEYAPSCGTSSATKNAKEATSNLARQIIENAQTLEQEEE